MYYKRWCWLGRRLSVSRQFGAHMWVLLLRTQVAILGELMENVRGSEDRLTSSLAARRLEGAVHICLCRYHLRMCESVKRKHVANRFRLRRHFCSSED